MDPEERPLGDATADNQRMAEEADLRESLEGLSLLSASNIELESLLTRVATYAVHAIPGADGAGLTLIEQDRPDTVVEPRRRRRRPPLPDYAAGLIEE